ncbi:hypothetical protein AVEN_210071-1 [Araneus ventricosus]|uniref:ISXO2-like transposase domain-containing protein n=1 Tax=Araneus ventricosus TaxID=182803 RepID=A0A4Y2PBX2_ARAVE|nr:hypothetical protein AVEN_26144-1 [Araneus ventricosus]GBN48586.1 hypothetical protein AVEN_210071-1 [Araneus ventricosus]
MSCCVKHRPFESQAGMYDSEFLYGLKKGSKKEVIEWCMGMDMIAKEFVCPTCGEKMVLTEENCSDGYAWVCRKFGVNEHHIKRTVRKGSWFEENKSTIPEVLILTYLWVKKTPNEWIVDEMNVSEPTVVDWKSFCREVCVNRLVKDSKDKLGGVGMVVEIDESKFGKRKYNRGKRVNETLIEITKKNVEPGSTILSDCWPSYNGLTAEGYVHCIINHSKNFKDPVTGVHTNGIEDTWNAIKTDFRKQGTRKVEGQFDTYLAEYMWWRSYRGASMKSLFPSSFEASLNYIHLICKIPLNE